MSGPDNPHDKLAREAIADINDAIALLRAVIPASLAELLDFHSLSPIAGTFVDATLHVSHADRLYSIRYQQRNALLYILWEHKSQSDKWTLLQLLRYMVRIWERTLAQKPAPRTLPPIIPVIMHYSESGWAAPTWFQGLFDREIVENASLSQFIPNFEVILDDITHQSDEALRARGLGPFGLLALLFLRDGRRKDAVLSAFAR